MLELAGLRTGYIEEIKGLTAMGRMAAYVLVALPFFLAITFTMINSTYMAPLWHTSAGHQVVFAGLIMMGLGALVLRRMVAFRG